MRLIDADTENERLLDFIVQNDNRIQYAIEHKDIVMLETIFFDYFEGQTIAYDVNKVMGNLKDSAIAHAIVGQQCEAEGFIIRSVEERAISRGLNVAIEIVKRGMVYE